MQLLARHLMPVIDTMLKLCKGVRRLKFYPLHVLEERRKTNPKARSWYHEIEYDSAMIRFWIERFVPAARQGIDLALGSPEEFYLAIQKAKREAQEAQEPQDATIEVEAKAIPDNDQVH